MIGLKRNKDYKILLGFICLISCTGNTEIKHSLNDTIPKIYFNEEWNGFKDNPSFRVNFSNEKEVSDIYCCEQYFYDTTFEYFLVITKTIPYNTTEKIIVCKKNNSISVSFNWETFSVPNELELNLDKIVLQSCIQGTVKKEQISFYENQILSVLNLKAYISDFKGWKYYSDGGYSMKLQHKSKFYAWEIDFMESGGLIEIENLWNTINLHPTISNLLLYKKGR